ncbi:MAG: ATP-binding protein [Bacteroidales bacterium]|jgi:PAS domain S-box-containing protein
MRLLVGTDPQPDSGNHFRMRLILLSIVVLLVVADKPLNADQQKFPAEVFKDTLFKIPKSIVLTNMHLIDSVTIKMLSDKRDSILKLINKGQSTEPKSYEAQLWTELGKIYQKRSDYQKAESAYTKALTLVPESELSNKAYLYLYLAKNYDLWDKHTEAVQYFYLAKGTFEQARNKPGLALAMQGLAKTNEFLGDYAEAIGLMHLTREIYSAIGNREGIASLEFDLGILLEKWNKTDAAMNHFQLAQQFYKEQNNTEKLAEIGIKIGQISLIRKQFNKALLEFDDVLNRVRETPYESKIRNLVLVNMGKVYQETGNNVAALYYYQQAIDYCKQIHDHDGLVQALQMAAEIHILLNKPSVAREELNLSIALADTLQIKEFQMRGWQILSEMNSRQHHYKEAYHNLLNYITLKDELFSLAGNQLINEITIRYETEQFKEAYENLKQKNELTNLALEKQKDVGSFTIIVATFIVLVSTIILIFIVLRSRESKRSYALLNIKSKKISEQKEVLSALNLKLTESREQYRSIVENATIGMYKTTPSGKVIFSNKALVKMLRYPEGFDLGTVDLNKSNPERKLFIKALEVNEVISGREDTWKRYDGTNMEVNESAWVVKDLRGEIQYYEGIVEDISQRKAVEKALMKSQSKQQKMNEELIANNKLIEKAKNEAIAANKIKSIFLANVSHEIRTPMNSIIGFSEIVSTLATNPQQHYYINSIKSSSSSLLALLNDILDLSKIQSGEIELICEPVSLHKITEDVINIFHLKAMEKNLKLSYLFDADFPSIVIMDGVRLRQVLTNLVGNTIKFTEEGSVDIKIKAEHENAHDRCTIAISVTDTGIGIAKEETDTIFEAFKQSRYLGEKAYSGTGLGLSISKQLIETMGGKIALKSTLGKGSAFMVTIPGIQISKTHMDKNNSKYHEYSTLKNSLKNVGDGLITQNYLTIPDIPDELKAGLQDKFSESWKEIHTSHFINELTAFANNLIAYANDAKLSSLEDYGNELISACNQFDIDKIEELMIGLKNIFANQSN